MSVSPDNTTLRVLLSHGLESGPDSTKMTALRERAEAMPGVEAFALDYRGLDSPAERLRHLQSYLADQDWSAGRTVLAGSSLGGWVSAAYSQQTPVLGCFLLAPAFGIEGFPESRPRVRADRTHIIHGWQDEVVPPGPVIELARAQRLSLHLVDDGHRLQHSLDEVLRAFDAFLAGCRDF